MENLSEDLSYDEAVILFETGKQDLSDYVQNNRRSTNTRLFSILALLNAYVPESYLCMTECQKILGPPDLIHGGPPFEDRMNPFIQLISPVPEQVRILHPVIAQRSVKLLDTLNISRNAIVKRCMSLCGVQPQSEVIQFIKDLLIRREMGERGKEKFSKLIGDILEQNNFYQAVQVLKMASSRFGQKYIFPQTVARLYYIAKTPPDYEEAERWAERAVERAQNNSYVADTLGQVHKNRLLRRAKQPGDVIQMAWMAFNAFKAVEEKAENEEGPEMNEIPGIVNISTTFNNRGLFGFIQVAKIVAEKLRSSAIIAACFPNLILEVEEKFDFFEWYLCYSQQDETTVEPDYFWKDVVLCYEFYTEVKVVDSSSFPGLLDSLNHGLFTSKGKRAGFEETQRTAATLETVREDLRRAYEGNVDDVKIAERYVLSHIIVSNRMPDSPQHTPVRELQGIIHSFLRREAERRSPEFYLLALLLYWPEELPQVQQQDDEESEEEDDELQDRTWDAEDVDEDEDTGGETARLSPDHTFEPDLQQCVTFMEEAFQRSGYAKYLRGRYLLPLFFLGRDSGLSRWIHKSQLDAVVERKVDAELVNTPDRNRNREKRKRINGFWKSGEVWHVPEIREILFPVRVESCRPAAADADDEEEMSDEEELFVCAGGKKIKARTEGKTDGPPQSPMLFYLAFNIRGPVVFKV